MIQSFNPHLSSVYQTPLASRRLNTFGCGGPNCTHGDGDDNDKKPKGSMLPAPHQHTLPKNLSTLTLDNAGSTGSHDHPPQIKTSFKQRVINFFKSIKDWFVEFFKDLGQLFTPKKQVEHSH